jgi:hypothetical protein
MSEEEYGKAPVVSPNEIGQCAAEAPVSSSDWIVRSSSIRNQCFLPTVDRAALRRLRASSPSSSSLDTPGYEDDTPELDVSTDSSLDLDVSQNSCASLCSSNEAGKDPTSHHSLETSGRSAWNGRLNLHLARKETLQALAELGRKYANPSQRPLFPFGIASTENDFGHRGSLDCGTRVHASTEYYPAPVIHIGCLLQAIHTTQTENPSYLSRPDPLLDRLADELLQASHTESVGPTIEAHSYWPKRAWQHWTCAVVVIVLCVTAVSVQCVHRPDFMGSLLFLGRMVTNCWTDPGWGNSTWTPHNGVYPFAKDLSFTMTRRDSMDVEQGANASLLLSVRYTEHPSREPVRFSGADQLPRCRWVRFPPGSAPYCGALGADNMHRRLRKPVLNSTRRDYTRLHLERAK